MASAFALDQTWVEQDLATHFATIPLKPANDRDRDLAAKGRTIYLEASCHARHGPNAKGVRDIPRLDGLAYVYLKARLEQWGIKPEHPYPLIGQFDLDQCAGTAFTIHIPMMPKGGGLDANLIQTPLVDFQGLERLESNLLKFCRFGCL